MTEKKGRERRRHPRKRVRMPGQVVILSGLRGRPPIACTLLDQSAGGALLKLDDTSVVPDDFYLQIDGGEFITCSVRRRGRKLLGVRFVPRAEGAVRTVHTHGF